MLFYVKTDSSSLKHYGILERSGRYPWGSGERPFQRLETFYKAYKELKKDGMSEKEIAEKFGMSTGTLRSKVTVGRELKYRSDQSMAVKLKDDGYSISAISDRLGVSQATVRNMLDPSKKASEKSTLATAEALIESLETVQYLDVGKGVENYMGISREKLKSALEVLKDEGYQVEYVKMQQLGTGKYTSMMVLAPPGTEYSELYKKRFEISQLPQIYSDDGGDTYHKIDSFTSLNSDRVQIVYGDQGGAQADGLIKIRRGVADIALGNSQYAQVRIGVDGTHYMKGMAVYADDMPSGVDIQYYTNKKTGTPKHDVFKKMQDIEDNPFGAVVRQQKYVGDDGKEHQSPVNIVREEGEWAKWSDNLSAQVLAKQPPTLVKSQLDYTYRGFEEEFNKLDSLTNPTVKKSMLESFADDCDSASVHLKAASLPRQSWKVILPVNELSPNEVYAPTYRDGERVVLFRYPHAGTFEAAELVVNNRNRSAKKMLGNASDAIGINYKVAEKMSGADFDGDFVIAIPNNRGRLRTDSALKELEGFDPKSAYPAYEGMPRMTKKTRGIQMGEVSNLITDMTLHNADTSEIAAAVRHSMVVIDAEKHYLNYQQSAIDNGIAKLKEKYQGSARGGASTLISRASASVEVPERSVHFRVDPNTGEKIYTESGRTRIDPKTGKTVLVTQGSTRMAETRDARTLSSGTVVEELYAGYANDLKALANKARKEAARTDPTPYNPTAAKTYEREVKELKSQLEIIQRNRPLERQAQVIANARVALAVEANPGISSDALKKLKTAALNEGRASTGASKPSIKLTQNQWNAIQAGALHPTSLATILENADMSIVRSFATPRSSRSITDSTRSRIRAMARNDYTISEIADALGVSIGTVQEVLGS